MKTDFDRFIKEALDLFNNLSDNGDVQAAKRLYKVLGELYNSPRIVSKNDLSVINEFVSSISFTEQFPPETTCTYSMVAKTMEDLEGLQALGYLVSILVSLLYWTVLESSPKQATLGKMALGIVVTDLEGQRISYARALGRYFSKFLSWVLLLIGFVMAGLTKKKQALHDMIARTLVIVKK